MPFTSFICSLLISSNNHTSLFNNLDFFSYVLLETITLTVPVISEYCGKEPHLFITNQDFKDFSGIYLLYSHMHKVIVIVTIYIQQVFVVEF